MKLLSSLFIIFIAFQNFSQQVEFYGLTSTGGEFNRGTIFKTNANGSVITHQYSFREENDGALPSHCNLLHADNGKLYGTLSDGGINNFGVLFEYDPTTEIYTVLHHFNNGGTDGYNPESSLVQISNGKIYGVTLKGGSSDRGVIFEYNLSTSNYAIAFDFANGSGLRYPKKGLAKGSNGMLYGTSSTINPDIQYNSTVFEFNPTSNTLTDYVYLNAVGHSPNCLLIEMEPGIFYGTTVLGGTNNMGTLFEYNSTTNSATPKYSLDGLNFQYTSDGINLAKNNSNEVIGTTTTGGTNYKGSIFKYTRSSNLMTTLYNFNSGTTTFPGSTLLKSTDGNFYGTSTGNSNNTSSIYRFNPTSNTYTNLNDLTSEEGLGSICGMTQIANGMLYGMFKNGGETGNGTLFEFNPTTSNYEVKVNFQPKDGSTPKESLFEASNGKLYGVTYGGGSQFGQPITSNYGIIFEYDPLLSKYRKIRSLQYFNGTNPSTTFMEASNGKIYGICSLGGTLNRGVLFELEISTGIVTVKHEFIDANGTHPIGKMVQIGSELFGMTTDAGSGNSGTIYKYNYATNTFTVVKNFTGTDGANPASSLILASDGFLYGTTENGGNSSLGVAFQFNPTTNGYLIGKHFNGTDGAHPRAGLFERSGFLLGTTAQGGTNDFGVIYEIELATGIFNKTFNFSGTNGKYPDGEFMLAPNGITYAMTKKGGPNDKGVIYRYNYSNNAFAVQSTFDGINGAEPLGGLIHISVCYPTASTDIIEACGPIVWIDGNTYGTSTDDLWYSITHTVPNAAGCDSVITLDYTRNNPTTSIDYQTHCGSYTWINNVTYTSSINSPTFVIQNSVGCDSTITLDLTITNEVYGTDNQVQCGSYTWIDGVNYTATNYTAQHTITLPSGCDSVVSLHLDIVNFIVLYDTVFTCGEN